ncbi:MAG: glycosyltransferase family 2 protein [Alphaproteobacteria bacterium]|nr:glycosyltransferase family 2 protein [Alphaproteobacteria bacterium]NCQ89242.1 glycosyltransferase family 2 protein [Alphaproteobacteria bacterium]NCT08381.1 glycosyltransferase family 2 protein [Alphaproteobacteria bacterium]
MIPVSVLITVYNEAENLPRCLRALQNFDEIIIIDSNSTDNTAAIAKEYGAHVICYQWDGQYPKKRQWCLDHLEIKYDFVFWVDADEVVTPDLISEIKNLSFDSAGYFVKGQYIWLGQALKRGLKNNKLALFDRRKIYFPVVDDLDIKEMGEMEGHYQPILKPDYSDEKIEQLNAELLHYACDDRGAWERRHERYAIWEAAMIWRGAYPKDPSRGREFIKTIFRKTPRRDWIAFVHSYIYKHGFLDGKAGYDFARSRACYYRKVAVHLKALASSKAQVQSGARHAQGTALHKSNSARDKKHHGAA